jgi:hypothetical protein
MITVQPSNKHYQAWPMILGYFFLLIVKTNGQAPYPQSNYIREIIFELETTRNVTPGNNLAAPGSDNWTITWADDGNQYTSWGDGGGFGGDDKLG